MVVVALLLGAAAVGLWWLKKHDFDLGRSADDAVGLLRAGGPWAFFGALAVLPAIGFPISLFYLAAGPAFGEQMGVGGVIAATGAALAVNLALTYWLARFALRPWLEQMISRTKYKIPVVVEAEQVELTVLVRITPGPPFFLQGYLLGLAGVRFLPYMAISWVIAIVYATGMEIFGDAVLHGRARVAVIGISILVAAGLAVHLLRRHYGKKRA